MIAIAKPPVDANDVHEQFLTMLPWITTLARRAFQRFNSERRNDLVHEVIATAYVAFARLVEQGKQDLAYATPLGNFAIRRVLDGRRAGTSMRRNDVMFEARGESGVKLIRRSDRIDDWHESLVEDHHAGPAETAAARIDLAGWLQSLPSRNRRIAKALSLGESTKDVASRFRVSPARVFQLRRELEASWLVYHGEAA